MEPVIPHQQDILLADDDKDDCLIFGEALKELQFGIRLTTVHNGDMLMQLLNKTELLPELLFLDLNMPRKNGMQCLSEIKQSPSLKELPVIIYSTSSQKDVIDLLYNLGAQFYIRKPSEFPSLKEIIHQALVASAALADKQPHKDDFVLTDTILR